jgi:hypothetical protein
MLLHKGKEYDWAEIRKEIAKNTFITSVLGFDPDTLPNQAKEFINKTFIKSDPTEGDAHKASVYKASKAAGPLADWVYS